MRTYKTPCAQKIAFDYKDQVVASNSGEGSSAESDCSFIGKFTNKGFGCFKDFTGEGEMNNA